MRASLASSDREASSSRSAHRDDPEDRETVCGLGNRKNRYFLDALGRKGA